jgi:hypothetical protein
MTVNPEERRYRVTAELRSVYQLVVQATSPEEAESFADAIDLEKSAYIEGEYQVVDVAKEFLRKMVRLCSRYCLGLSTSIRKESSFPFY